MLAHLAHVPSLVGGIVAFDAKDLSGGRWCDPIEDYERPLSEVWAPVPPFDNERELLERCEELILLALQENARARRENAAA